MLRKQPKGCRYFYICTDLPVMNWINDLGKLAPKNGELYQYQEYIGGLYWPWRKADALKRPEQTVLQICAKTYMLCRFIR